MGRVRRWGLFKGVVVDVNGCTEREGFPVGVAGVSIAGLTSQGFGFHYKIFVGEILKEFKLNVVESHSWRGSGDFRAKSG